MVSYGEVQLPLTIFSMWCVYHMAWYWFFRFFFRQIPHFKKTLQDLNIPYESEVEWYCRCVSTEHAIGSLILGTLWHFGILSEEVALTHTAGYFLYDSCVVLTHLKDFKEDTSTLIHHAVGVFGTWASLLWRIPPWLVKYYLLTEVSTVFVNLRWKFYLLQMKEWKIYAIVGLLMALSFFLVRTVPLPYVWVRGVVLTWYYHEPATVYLGVAQCAFVTVLCGLNAYWSVLIFRGLMKFFRGPPRARNVGPIGSERTEELHP
jgi:hypothetical protein